MNDALKNEQFDLLRTKIEAAIETPAVIMVTSACAGDGKSVTSYGLVTSFAQSGYRAALIDANPVAPAIGDDRGPSSFEQFIASGPDYFARTLPDSNFQTISFLKDSLRRNSSRPVLSKAIDACREAYEITIIDASPFSNSNLTIMLAHQATALILTVREGRAVKRADHELIKALDELAVPTLGSVTTSAKLIRDFRVNVGRRRSAIRTLPVAEQQARAFGGGLML